MINYATLSLDQSPPLSVPLRFFLTAPLFLALAGGLLLVGGESWLTTRWHPGTLALTHLITLGVLAMAMCGALMQFLPVAAGSALPWPRFSAGTVHALLTPGALLLPWGLYGGERWATLAGAALLGLALALFIGFTVVALARAKAAYATVRAVRLALAALAVTALLGLHLAMGHGGLAPLARQLTDTHAAWGLGGWVAILVVGVAYQVVPLFQITPDYPKPLQRWLAPSLLLALIGLLVATLVPAAAPLRWLGIVLLGGGLAAFAVATLRLQQRRKRKIQDATLWFWRLGMALILITVAGGIAHVAGVPGVELLFGISAVVLFPLTLISGMAYKIVPFLVWLHLHTRAFKQGAVGVKVPNMKEVISEKAARRHFWAHLAATITLAGAALQPELLARPAAALVMVTAGLFGWNLWRASVLYRRTNDEMERLSTPTNPHP